MREKRRYDRESMKIYFDNAATTKPIEKAAEIMQKHMEKEWNNPSAMYTSAVEAETKLKNAHDIIKSAVRAEKVIITSGGTESNNMAIFRGTRKYTKPMHYITSAYEHACVYECMRELESMGNSISFIKPREDGKIHAEDVAAEVRENTALVSIMHVNNETGAINDIDAIAKAVKKANRNTVFHSDGVQGFIKVPFDMRRSSVDYYTASAHKVHGIKGTGAIFCREKSTLRPLILGGGQENGMRSGTENTLGAAVFAAAVEEYMKNYDEYLESIKAVRNAMIEGINSIEDTRIISPEDGAAHILSASFLGVRSEVLLHSIAARGIEISVGSACSSKKRKNRVHEALNLSTEIAEGVVRLSFGHNNTVEEAKIAVEIIREEVEKLRRFRRM